MFLFLRMIFNSLYDVLGKRMLDETLMMVVSDHGGYRKTHGKCNGPNKECLSYTMTATMNVPLLLKGKFLVEYNNIKLSRAKELNSYLRDSLSWFSNVVAEMLLNNNREWMT